MLWKLSQSSDDTSTGLRPHLEHLVVPVGAAQHVEELIQHHAAHLGPRHQHRGQGRPLVGHLKQIMSE